MPVITFKQFAKMLHHLPEDLNKAANEGMIMAGHKSVPEVEKKIRSADPYPLITTRRMITSVRSEGTWKPMGKRRRTVVEIVVDTPYAQAMEFGAAPHTPPLDKLIEWARYKIASFKSSKIAGKGRGSKIVSNQKASKLKRGIKKRPKLSKSKNAEAARMAYLVQQKIKKKGIKPRFYMAKSMPKINFHVKKQLRKSMKRLGKKYPIRVTIRKIR